MPRRNLWELTKPRLTSLVVATAIVGFLVGSPAQPDWRALALMTLGIFAVVGGANALNQYWERDVDARMWRTRDRPIPAGRLAPRTALIFGLAISGLGLAVLGLLVNPPAMLAALAGWISYVLIYTPAKQRTAASTLIGAFPGAVPPLVGWAAARGAVETGAWALFAIVFVWQIPHFFAIARHHRKDYARGGFPTLGVQQIDGTVTNRLSAAYAFLLVPLGALPVFLGLAGNSYLTASLVLGVAFFATTLWALRAAGDGRQKWVFVGSLLYLIGIVVVLVADRVPRP